MIITQYLWRSGEKKAAVAIAIRRQLVPVREQRSGT
jgi:hypothetical protein